MDLEKVFTPVKLCIAYNQDGHPMSKWIVQTLEKSYKTEASCKGGMKRLDLASQNFIHKTDTVWEVIEWVIGKIEVEENGDVYAAYKGERALIKKAEPVEPVKEEAPPEPVENPVHVHKKMSNSDVLSAFLSGATRGKSGNLKIDGGKLVNYGTVIAERVGNVMYINITRYSKSTSKIVNQFKGMCLRMKLPVITVHGVKKEYDGSLVDRHTVA